MDDMVIVGCAGAIGSHLMRAFASEYRLLGIFHNLTPKPLLGAPHRYVIADVAHYEDVEPLVDIVELELGPRIVLVNAVGKTINGTGHRQNPRDVQDVLNTNLLGAFNLCRAFLPLMRDRAWGRIINLSSVVGLRGVPGASAYAASKAGLLSMTRTLAVENARKGITVNALNLGYMEDGLINAVPEDARGRIIEDRIPMRRLGNLDNITAAVRFLIDADYVTGTAIDIDGGFLCS